MHILDESDIDSLIAVANHQEENAEDLIGIIKDGIKNRVVAMELQGIRDSMIATNRRLQALIVWQKANMKGNN